MMAINTKIPDLEKMIVDDLTSKGFLVDHANGRNDPSFYVVTKPTETGWQVFKNMFLGMGSQEMAYFRVKNDKIIVSGDESPADEKFGKEVSTKIAVYMNQLSEDTPDEYKQRVEDIGSYLDNISEYVK